MGKKRIVNTVNAQKAVIANTVNMITSHDWDHSEGAIAEAVITELENRRCLYNDYDLEIPRWVVQSARELRVFLHDKAKVTNRQSALNGHLRTMRSACRKFLDKVGDDETQSIIIDNAFGGTAAHWKFFTALGEMRSAIGISLGALLAAYDLDCEPDLATIVPIVTDDEA